MIFLMQSLRHISRMSVILQILPGLGYDKRVISEVINMVDFSEYKRRQGSPG